MDLKVTIKQEDSSSFESQMKQPEKLHYCAVKEERIEIIEEFVENKNTANDNTIHTANILDNVAIKSEHQHVNQEALQLNDEVIVINCVDDCIFEDEDNADISGYNKACENPLKLEIEEEGVHDVGMIKDQVTFEGTSKRFYEKQDSKNLDQPYKRKFRQKYDHDPKRKLICADCGFKAVKKHHLASHIQNAHQRKDPVQTSFSCEFCMFKTRFKTSLSHHKSRFHIEEIAKEKYVDVRPKKSSFDIKSLNVEDYTDSKNGSFYCQFCSYSTTEKHIMRGHLPIHVVEKKPVIQCDHCPERYTQSSLNVHMKKVHFNGIYKCPKCIFATKYAPNYRRHLKENKDRKVCRLVQKRKGQIFDRPDLEKATKEKYCKKRPKIESDR